MATLVKNKKGFIIVKLSQDEAINKLHFGTKEGYCLCAECNKPIKGDIYYVTILNDTMDKDCLIKWIEKSTYYKQDRPFEEYNYEDIKPYVDGEIDISYLKSSDINKLKDNTSLTEVIDDDYKSEKVFNHEDIINKLRDKYIRVNLNSQEQVLFFHIPKNSNFTYVTIYNYSEDDEPQEFGIIVGHLAINPEWFNNKFDCNYTIISKEEYDLHTNLDLKEKVLKHINKKE